MKGLVKAARIIRQVVDVIMGKDITTTSEGAFKYYLHLAFAT